MKRIFTSLVIILGLFFCVNNAFSQVEVVTKNDNTYYGIVTYENIDTLCIVSLEQNTITFLKKSVKTITNLKLSVITFNSGEIVGTVARMDDSTYTIETDGGEKIRINKRNIKNQQIIGGEASSIKPSYMMVGGSLGTPSGVQVVVGFQSNSLLGGRICGGYIGSAYGFQGNLLFNLSKSRNFEQNLSIGAGYSVMEERKYDYYYDYYYHSSKEWGYVGGFYDLNYYGFFLEAGLSIGDGNYTNPQLLIQLGYVYRFWK